MQHSFSENRKPPLPEPSAAAEPPFEVRSTATGRCLIARRNISAGAPLFGEDDFADETERRSFRTLSQAQLRALSTAESAAQARHSRQRPVGRTPGARMEGVPGRHPAHLELAVEFELRIRYCGEWKRTLELQHRLAPRMEDNDLTDACSHDLRVAARHVFSCHDDVARGVATKHEGRSGDSVFPSVGQRDDAAARIGGRLPSLGLRLRLRHRLRQVHRLDVLGAAAAPLVDERELLAADLDLIPVE